MPDWRIPCGPFLVIYASIYNLFVTAIDKPSSYSQTIILQLNKENKQFFFFTWVILQRAVDTKQGNMIPQTIVFGMTLPLPDRFDLNLSALKTMPDIQDATVIMYESRSPPGLVIQFAYLYTCTCRFLA